MPTYEERPEFWRDWARLGPAQQTAFLEAVRDMVEDLKAKRPFRAGLRVGTHDIFVNP